jgi:hypothetical protein
LGDGLAVVLGIIFHDDYYMRIEMWELAQLWVKNFIKITKILRRFSMLL